MTRGLSWRNFDFLLLGAIVLASAFGVAMIRSAVAGNDQLTPLVGRQTYFALGGLVAIFLIAAIDYHYWLALYRPIYFGIMILLILLSSSLGQAAFGSQRWYQIGGLFIQPTEFAKIVVILILARYFDNTQNEPRNIPWIVRAFLWVFFLAIWILLQPNLSNVIVIMVIFFAMLWINGLDLRQLAIIGASAMLMAVAVFPFLQTYQQDRVLNFIRPQSNVSYGATYNVEQALIAIGSGGLFGKGYGHGTQTQLRFLKVRHTDFIFSATAEEFGMVGALLVILIEIFIVWRCIRAAQKARDVSGAMIAYGVAILLFFQGMANIAVNLNLLPVSGLPLPFVSYGGSGLASLMLGVGLVESVVMRHKPLEF
ncbi:MAG TPA: FtsW/RodA/SpoVE family cell cycle protein [Anaerolineales bacterium]|nr:FtsW/RodA/SpoVE family cell cycle protein [Anaerolineales bacterium]